MKKTKQIVSQEKPENAFKIMMAFSKQLTKAQQEKKEKNSTMNESKQSKVTHKRKRDVFEEVKNQLILDQKPPASLDEIKQVDFIANGPLDSALETKLEHIEDSFSKMSLQPFEEEKANSLVSQTVLEDNKLCTIVKKDSKPLLSEDIDSNLSNLINANEKRGKSYKSYPLEFKASFIKLYLKYGLSLACMMKHVDSSTASKWVKKFKEDNFEGLEDKRSKNGAKSNEQLDKYVFQKFIENRTKGIPITIQTIQKIALGAPNSIIPKDFQGSIGWVQNFLRRHNIVTRKKTHAAQQLISKITENILTYFDHLQDVHSWKDESIIFANLDEMALYFDLSSDYTLHFKGAKEVKVLSHASSKTRVSFMPCVTSLGDVLPSLFVGIYTYGQETGREYPNKFMHFKNQTDPFMLKFSGSGSNNDAILSDYITRVLKPWKETRNLNMVLILDEAPCHLTENVLKALKAAKILPIFIPGGCTSILQPLDVSLNKSIKSHIRASYSAWLEKQGNKSQPSIEPPSLQDLFDWSQAALSALPKENIINSFICTGISEELSELKDQQKLTTKLGNLFDEHLERIGKPRDLLDDVASFYYDARDNEVLQMNLDQDLDLIEDE